VSKPLWTAAMMILAPFLALAPARSEGPATRDLGFLVGTWKITAVHYDVSDPQAPERRETGTKTCRWALESEGEPAFVFCENESVYESGGETWREAYLEYLNYNPYVEAFEKTNLFAGFPVKVIERVAFDAATGVVEIRGRVEVGNSVESYVETWRFDRERTAFEREALINRSSMPLTEYRKILSGRGVRVVE